MARNIQRNWDHQIYAIANLDRLSSYEAGRYEITEFKVEEWAGGHVNVSRVKKPLHAQNVAYHESYVVGPRGKVKQIYSSLY